MKNKPLRHKDDNVFKFKPFAERISSIDIDVFHRIAHSNEEDTEELECYFYQTIQKWNVLNLTESYDAFRKEVSGIITLPQLIHKKDHVVEILLKHLKLKNPLSLQPLLECIVALAKDLRKDFYPFYPDISNQLIVLLNSKNSEQLEWTFTCLAYLFKFLWRYLIKDIGDVVVSLLPLLSDNKPPYISNFAAESFSFVARKVKDKEKFLELVLETVKMKQDGISGCGKLLFEVIRGIKGNFHSCVEATLPFYFESLSKDTLPQDILFQVLQHVISNITQYIYPRNSEPLWKSLIGAAEKCLNYSDISEKTSKNLELVLKLIIETLRYRDGRTLNSPDILVKHYMKLITAENLPENVLQEVVNLGALLLVSKSVQLSQEHASSVVRKTLQLENKNVVLSFIDNLVDYAGFEPLVLPVFLKYYGQSLDEAAFRVLTKLILRKSPLALNGISLSSWNRYPLEFSSSSGNVLDHLLSFLNKNHISEILGQLENFTSALICIPHVNSLNHEAVFKILKQLTRKICKEIQSRKNGEEEVQKLLFILLNVVECAIHILKPEAIEKLFSDLECLDTLFDLVQLLPYTVCCLRIVDIFVAACCKTSFISFENLKVFHAKLLKFLSSPFHQVRLLTTHIYSLFETVPDLNKNSEEETWEVFSLCYKVESIEPMIHTYRDQLQSLRKLSVDKPQSVICQKTEFNTVPVRYCLGALYMNFKLLWDPIISIIEGYANGMSIQIFWEVFVAELTGSSERARKEIDLSFNSVETNVEFIASLYSEVISVGQVPDFVNYRLLLWKAVGAFPDVAEARSRDISSLMLSFIEDEYRRSNATEAFTWNIKQNTEDRTDAQNMEDEEDEEEKEEEDEDAQIKKALTQPTVKSSGKANLKLLLTALSFFTKIKSPKSLYREPELYKLYLDLLSHRDAEVQKTALDCIMVYKHKHLIPYRENLYSLIDDKKFKTELALFRINKDTTVVQEEHRAELIPLVLQIVHSKMTSKTGLRTGGKAGGHARRSLVLRFLAGCHQHEMSQFLHMSFRFYSEFLQDDVEKMVEEIIKGVDLQKFVPPKRLQSSLNLLLIVIEQFGGLMGDDLLQYLLKILFVIGATLRGAFQQKSCIYAGYLSPLKQIKTTCQVILNRFFARFSSYPWTSKEINLTFDLFVWPWLNNFASEGVQSPTALLKLFHQWSLNPRYFALLAKHKTDNINQYPLSCTIDLLLTNKVHPSVTNTIMEMVEKLLLLKPDESDSDPPLKVDNVVPIPGNILKQLKLNEKLNYGSCILLNFVPKIVEKLKRKLYAPKGVSQRELFIMSRISELVWEPEACDVVLTLMIPLAAKRAAGGVDEETILQLITTVYNLIRTVSNPQKHLRRIAPLFFEVTAVPARKLLCEILNAISEKQRSLQPSREDVDAKEDVESSEMDTTARIVQDLNSYNKKWIDQPDFERRHSAFKSVEELVRLEKIGQDLGALLVYTSFFFVRHEEDLALREGARHSLRLLILHLAQKYPKDSLVNEILFSLIIKGFRSKSENYRYESISLLGHMARECPNAHFVLRDLSLFSNKSDLEVDVFENLLHLQLYRQARALNKFNQICATLLKAPHQVTLMKFILPLVSAYLVKDKYSSKNSLIDSSIEAVKNVCHMLPWRNYVTVLRFYLGQLRYKLDFQRQLVRLTVAILDAYHFDISRAKLAQTTFNKSKTETQSQNSSNKTRKYSKRSKSGTESTEKYPVNLPRTTSFDNLPEINLKKSQDSLQEDDNSKAFDPENPEDSDLRATDVEAMLDEIPDDDEDTEEEEEEELPEQRQQKPDVPVVLRETILSPSAAKTVLFNIRKILLPQLNRAMAEMTHHEGSHKVNRKKKGAEREDDELQKVPISLAVVKLLQKLPDEILDLNLPGVLIKLCTFFKSRLESVRKLARETLLKIMQSLGPKYLSLLFSEMSTLLSRGFQVHVLIYTMHSVLTTLKDLFQPTDIDKCLLTILNICKLDIFGVISEEKEVAKLITKTSEAKSTKSFDTFQIMAEYITEKCLLDLLLPIKEILILSHSHKIVNKAQECLRRIVMGLVDNKFITVQTLLVFAHGTASESIPQFMIDSGKPKLSETELEKKAREKSDCFIIPKPPVYKSGTRLNAVRNSATANAHVLVEFGLQLCFFILKKEKVEVSEYDVYIDPFVTVFKNCLTSRHVKMCTITIQCLSLVIKYDLSSMKKNLESIITSLFELLHKYAAEGLSKGDNFDLVVAAFKAMAIVVRDVKYHTISADQLKMLLIYVEQDLHDHDRQSTAFALLRAILTRNLVVPEIHDVMKKVAELNITSDLPHVRLQCRQAFHQFLMEYPLGKKLEKHLAFYMTQLSYGLQSGRESCLETIFGFINSFPIKILEEQAGMFFVMLGARLVNDESPECRKMVAKCILTMLERLSKTQRDSLFDIVKTWFSEVKISHQRLAAQLCGLIITVEKAAFSSRLPELIPLIKTQLSPHLNDNKPGKFVRLAPVKISTEDDDEKDAKPQDHHMFQLLQMLLKLAANCPPFLSRTEDIEDISYYVQNLLAHPHEWVRISAAQFIGYVLSSLNADHLSNLLLAKKADEKGFLYNDPENGVKSLTLDLCDQLQPGHIKPEMAEQIVKNLVFMARVLQKLPVGKSANDDQKFSFNLFWLTKRMRKIINQEIVETPKSTILRTQVFKWIAGVITTVNVEKIHQVLLHLFAPLVREMATTELSNAPLRQLAREVGRLLKSKIGNELYVNTLSKLQLQLNARRAEHKKKRKQLAITDPELAAQKKIKLQERKKEGKKRKMERMKGKRPFVKRRRVELDDSAA